MSCKKTGGEKAPKEYSDSIKGTWELRYVIGIQDPRANPNYSPGNGNIWQFGDSTYKYYRNAQLEDSGLYSLTKDTAFATGQYIMDALHLKQGASPGFPFQIDKDTLLIFRGIVAADGSIEKFVRLEN
ncbi:MAG: hypothetical protein ABI683_12180 [Ginsengibacter sp.]